MPPPVKRECDCNLWRENIGKVNAPNQLLFARNPDTYKGYDGVKFKYCPWCGQLLPGVSDANRKILRSAYYNRPSDRS